uniref:Water stress-responsive protein 7 (Fragments) n=1 Tax=Pinus pinaster TaxID=71647 RepID=WSP7_PINPS|nr:RecName: Full=Water stress-responsive protein 7 [Pinus pinaster]
SDTTAGSYAEALAELLTIDPSLIVTTVDTQLAVAG